MVLEPLVGCTFRRNQHGFGGSGSVGDCKMRKTETKTDTNNQKCLLVDAASDGNEFPLVTNLTG